MNHSKTTKSNGHTPNESPIIHGNPAVDLLRQIADNTKKKPRTVNEKPRTVRVEPDKCEINLNLLNSLQIWRGRLKFDSVKRRGAMLIATVIDGEEKTEIVWTGSRELFSFVASQAIIADATGVAIPAPPHGEIRQQWEPVAEVLSVLAAQDKFKMEPALKEEIRELLRLVWYASKQKTALNNLDWINYVRECQTIRRDSVGAKIPPCVFVAEEATWVHVPSFRTWLSIPTMTNRLPPLADVRNGLILLGFTYQENVDRGYEGDSETACLWKGPLEIL